MQVGSSLSTGAFASLTSSPSSSASSAASDPLVADAPTGDTSTDLMKFLKMTPAQKMDYQWMSSHHLTQQSLASMTSDQRDAIRQQMASDLKQKAQQTMDSQVAKSNGGVNILA
jgi:hypothetical protein